MSEAKKVTKKNSCPLVCHLGYCSSLLQQLPLSWDGSGCGTSDTGVKNGNGGASRLQSCAAVVENKNTLSIQQNNTLLIDKFKEYRKI